MKRYRLKPDSWESLWMTSLKRQHDASEQSIVRQSIPAIFSFDTGVSLSAAELTSALRRSTGIRRSASVYVSNFIIEGWLEVVEDDGVDEDVNTDDLDESVFIRIVSRGDVSYKTKYPDGTDLWRAADELWSTQVNRRRKGGDFGNTVGEAINLLVRRDRDWSRRHIMKLVDRLINDGVAQIVENKEDAP